MRIKKIINQSRRDFTAIYVCESCGHEHTDRGYDDANFHNKVIPAMKCSECGKTASSEYKPLATKYPDSQVV